MSTLLTWVYLLSSLLAALHQCGGTCIPKTYADPFLCGEGAVLTMEEIIFETSAQSTDEINEYMSSGQRNLGSCKDRKCSRCDEKLERWCGYCLPGCLYKRNLRSTLTSTYTIKVSYQPSLESSWSRMAINAKQPIGTNETEQGEVTSPVSEVCIRELNSTERKIVSQECLNSMRLEHDRSCKLKEPEVEYFLLEDTSNPRNNVRLDRSSPTPHKTNLLSHHSIRVVTSGPVRYVKFDYVYKSGDRFNKKSYVDDERPYFMNGDKNGTPIDVQELGIGGIVELLITPYEVTEGLRKAGSGLKVVLDISPKY